MIIGTKGSVLGLLKWQWKFMLFATLTSTAICVAHIHFELTWLKLPSFPLAVVGAALGIFVSFRTNSSYDRWWEGRKLWGRMINTSRHITLEAKQYLHGDDAKRAVTRRHIAYVHTLRASLREQALLDDEHIVAYLDDDEKELFKTTSNGCNRLLERQMAVFTQQANDGHIDAFRLQSLDESIRHLLDIQGGCERIKKTPLPRIYGFFAERMIQWFSGLVPLALVPEMGWWAIPVAILVAFGFKMISETGRVLEDPFNMFWNGLPLSTISRMIEINVLDLMDETDLPAPHPPLSDTVIM